MWHGRRDGRSGGEAFGHGGYARGQGGRQRMFAASELRLVLLALIAREQRHGYDLIRLVEEQTRGAYVPSAGVVYPALSLLEDLGQVVSREQPGGRKAYSITPAGEAELAANAAEIAALHSRLNSLGRAVPDQHAPVRRAMDNLKMALGNALAAPNEGIAFTIAAIIDEAAQKIERLG